MRMTIDHFGTYVARDLVDGETSCFLLNSRMEIHLEQHVAELFA